MEACAEVARLDPSQSAQMERRQEQLHRRLDPACWRLSRFSEVVESHTQGQTLESRVGVLLTSSVWTHGLLYVALGRVVHPANIRVLCPAQGRRVINVVYTDVLRIGEGRS